MSQTLSICRRCHLSLGCILQACKELQQNGHEIPGKVLTLARQVYPIFTCFIHPDYHSVIPSELTSCGNIVLEFQTGLHEFVLAHDSLGRTFFLPVDHNEVVSGTQWIWSRFSYGRSNNNNVNHSLARVYDDPVVLQLLFWTRMSYLAPLSCCPATSTISFTPELLRHAAEIRLTTCEQCQMLARIVNNDSNDSLASVTRRQVLIQLRKTRQNDPRRPVCFLNLIKIRDKQAQFKLHRPAQPKRCLLCGEGFSLCRQHVKLGCGHEFHADWRCCVGEKIGLYGQCPLCLIDVEVLSALYGLRNEPPVERADALMTLMEVALQNRD